MAFISGRIFLLQLTVYAFSVTRGPLIKIMKTKDFVFPVVMATGAQMKCTFTLNEIKLRFWV